MKEFMNSMRKQYGNPDSHAFFLYTFELFQNFLTFWKIPFSKKFKGVIVG